MFCSQCKKEIPNNSKFCPLCGDSIEQENNLPETDKSNESERVKARENIYLIEINSNSIVYKHDLDYKTKWDSICTELKEKICNTESGSIFFGILFFIGLILTVVIAIPSLIFSINIVNPFIIIIPTFICLLLNFFLGTSIDIKLIENEKTNENYIHYFSTIGNYLNRIEYNYFNGFLVCWQKKYISQSEKIEFNRQEFNYDIPKIKFDSYKFQLKTKNYQGIDSKFYFYPTFFIEENSKTTLYYYRDISLEYYEDIVKTDSRISIGKNITVVDSSWKYANKDGSKNKVYADRNNYKMLDIKVGNIKLGGVFWLLVTDMDIYYKIVDCIEKLKKYSTYKIIDTYENVDIDKKTEKEK